jgi:hypothetical protein
MKNERVLTLSFVNHGCRLISAELLRKKPAERLTMTELLSESLFFSKVCLNFHV